MVPWNNQKSNSVQVVWFKRDLRIFDHAPLSEAVLMGKIVPLYIVEPKLWSLPDSSRRHWHFIHDSILELQNKLSSIGTPLILRKDEALKVFQNLHHQLGPFTLWSHEETGNDWTYQRDLSVKKWCLENNITWKEFPTNAVVRKLKNRDGWSALRDHRMTAEMIKAPKSAISVSEILSEELPAKTDLMFGDQDIENVQKGGRTEAVKILDSFLKERGKSYMKTISKPGVSARHCSRLSPHITFGTLSVREIEKATKAKMASLLLNPNSESSFFHRNLDAFLSRLAWHCHFIQKLEQQPEIEFHCMHPAFEGMRESEFNSDFFEAWKMGQTGYPLIDACMRSLHANGWINFRMRAMIVSFASYNLWLDWRKTAPFLAQLFTDYEPGIHYSQFQMQSGVTGINTVRIYNPIKQSYEQDPDGNFIRRYVPELKNIPTSFIHEPWKMFEPPKDYPKPIVVHEESMRFARSEISKRWKQEGFKTEARQINQKLGSRNKPAARRKKTIKKDTKQLSFDV